MLKRLFLLVALVGALMAAPAIAQLPSLGLPNLPAAPNVGDVTGRPPDTVDDTVTGAARDLRNIRRNAVASLLVRHRDTLEADPDGNPIVRREVLAIAPGDAALASAVRLGFRVLRRDDIDGAGALVVLQAPPGTSTAAALETLRGADAAGVYDFDHLNLPSGSVAAASVGAAAAPSALSGTAHVGLIDGGVGAHAALNGAIAEQRAFNGEQVVATAHATAVASLLAGRGHGVTGAAPNAQLYVADIYGGQPTGGSSAALARAIGWLTSLGVPVINVSLVGPRNEVMEAIVANAVRRGFLIVAAVGNDGPAAPPLYPAAYPGVVGVTGVDARNRVLVEAERGPQVSFAAAGIGNAAALRGVAPVRGTSFAAPIVAGLLALRTQSVATNAAGLRALQSNARDLGVPGRDDVYGYGLVGDAQRSLGSR